MKKLLIPNTIDIDDDDLIISDTLFDVPVWPEKLEVFTLYYGESEADFKIQFNMLTEHNKKTFRQTWDAPDFLLDKNQKQDFRRQFTKTVENE